jgi:hypothetical protein
MLARWPYGLSRLCLERTMTSDIRFEAAFIRAGLLVGLVHERDVSDWAADRIGRTQELGGLLADVLLAPPELSPMRAALQPLGDGVGDARVAASLLTTLALEQVLTSRQLSDRLRVLGHIRQEFVLPIDTAVAIKEFSDRMMLWAAGVAGTRVPDDNELTMWLEQVRTRGYFRFGFDDSGEAAAFVAAVSRKLSRDQRWGDRAGLASTWAWIAQEGDHQARVVVTLNERAWLTVAREFAPVPLASRVPYPAPPDVAAVLMDERHLAALGADDAHALITG